MTKNQIFPRIKCCSYCKHTLGMFKITFIMRGQEMINKLASLLRDLNVCVEMT